MLKRQYRMNEQIAEFPSKQIYDGDLKTGPPNKEWTIDGLQPLAGINVQGEEQTHETTHSKFNPTEAEIVANHVKLLTNHDAEMQDIGVITPYTAQITAIRDAIQDIVGSDAGLKIDTIDSFQGSEREAIIVSFVRSNSGHYSGFLAFPEEGKRRLNVALTRAKRRLVVIGDWQTLGAPASHETPDSCSEYYSYLHDMLSHNKRLKSI